MCETYENKVFYAGKTISSSCLFVNLCQFLNIVAAESGCALYIKTSCTSSTIQQSTFRNCYGKSNGAVIFSISTNIKISRSSFFKSHASAGSGVVYGSCFSTYGAKSGTIEIVSSDKCPESDGHDGIFLLQDSTTATANNVNVTNSKFYKAAGLIMCQNGADTISFYNCYNVQSDIYHALRYQEPKATGKAKFISIVRCTSPYGFGYLYSTTSPIQYLYNCCFCSNKFSYGDVFERIIVSNSSSQCLSQCDPTKNNIDQVLSHRIGSPILIFVFLFLS